MSAPASEAPLPPAPQPKPVWRELALSVSLANLCFFEVWHRLLFADRFFLPPWSGKDLAALGLNVALLSTGFWVVMAAARSSSSDLLAGIRRALPLLALLVFLDLLWLRYERELRDALAAHEGLLVAAALALIATYSAVRWRRPLLAAAEVFAISLAAFVPVTFGQAAWRYLAAPAAAETRATASASAATPTSGRRVVWIVFDEMDARPAFLARPTGLRLPHLDRLRAEALYAASARQAGLQTVAAMTSILAGRQVHGARPQDASELLVSFQADAEPREPFSLQPSLFSRVREAGLATAAVGWYLPYCRLLGSALTRCDWLPMDAPARQTNPSLAAILAEQWRSLLPLEKRRNHRAQYEAILRRAREYVDDPSLALVLVHLPVPHEPGIYDRSRSEITLWSFRDHWYLDNLALADRALGELRQAMEHAGVWHNTTVLVTSDHSLRYYREFNTQTDSRVPFLLKLAGNSQPLTYSADFNTLATHELLLAILRSDIADTTAAARWLDDYAAPASTGLPAK